MGEARPAEPSGTQRSRQSDSPGAAGWWIAAPVFESTPAAPARAECVLRNKDWHSSRGGIVRAERKLHRTACEFRERGRPLPEIRFGGIRLRLFLWIALRILGVNRNKPTEGSRAAACVPVTCRCSSPKPWKEPWHWGRATKRGATQVSTSVAACWVPTRFASLRPSVWPQPSCLETSITVARLNTTSDDSPSQWHTWGQIVRPDMILTDLLFKALQAHPKRRILCVV